MTLMPPIIPTGNPSASYLNSRASDCSALPPCLAHPANGEEASRHEFRHALLHREKVLRPARPVRQLVDSPRTRKRVHQCAGDEVVAPEDVLLVGFGQRLFEQLD